MTWTDGCIFLEKNKPYHPWNKYKDPLSVCFEICAIQLTYNKNISFMFWHTLVKTKFCINYKYVLHIYVSTWFSFYNFILLQFHAGDLCPFMTCCTIGVVENSWTNKSFLLGSQLLKYEPFQCFLFYVLFILSTTYVKYFTEQPCCSALYTINHLLFIDDRLCSRAAGMSFMYYADS